MPEKLDLTKEYGLVLEGGGAKGAYQIGVWKALREFGVKVKGIAGVSVGALNGALICMDDFELAEELWNNITYSQVMEVDDLQMSHLMRGRIKEIGFNELAGEGAKFLISGGFNIQPLRTLINEYLDEDKVRNSPIRLYLGTICLTELKEIEVLANELEDGLLKDYLLASAYFPAFRNEKLHGKKYIDGGVFNNVPIDMLLNKDYKDIIVVRIFGLGLERRVKIPDDVTIIDIAPRVNLGNLLDFDTNRSKRNMKIGYFDAVRTLEGLDGKIYYIRDTSDDSEYLRMFIGLHSSVKMAFLEFYRLDYTNPEIYTRLFLEHVCPKIAADLKLSKHWTYKELFLTMLEVCAKNLKIKKYKVYDMKELRNLIDKRYMQTKDKESISDGTMFSKDIFFFQGMKISLFIRLLIKAIILSK